MADTEISNMSDGGAPQIGDFTPIVRSGSNFRTTQQSPPILQADIAISSAELLALNTVPKTLVAAGGSLTIHELVSIIIFLDFNSIAYTSVGGVDDLAVRYTNGSGSIIGGIETVGFLDQSSDQFRIGKAFAPQLPDFPDGVNSPIILELIAAIADGNSPLGVRVFYRTHDLSTLSAT